MNVTPSLETIKPSPDRNLVSNPIFFWQKRATERKSFMALKKGWNERG
jgi:hypothetical protein